MPKRGGLKPAGKRQESATFLQRSGFDVAVQFFVCCSAAFGPNDFRTAEKPMLQCSSCSAAFRKLQRNFRFRLWHVAGVGFRGVGLRICWMSQRIPLRLVIFFSLTEAPLPDPTPTPPRGCEVQRNRSRSVPKGPDSPWKGSNQARKGPIFTEGFLPDFLRKFGA